MTEKEKSSIGKIGAGVAMTPELLSLLEEAVRETLDLFLKRVSREELIAMWETAQEKERERREPPERKQRGRIKGRLR